MKFYNLHHITVTENKPANGFKFSDQQKSIKAKRMNERKKERKQQQGEKKLN